MLGLLLLQVLASCLWLGQSEVVTSFASCSQFFYAGTPPNDVLHPENPAWICQRYNNSYHYATLYDREKRIPVYSAYIYKAEHHRRPDPDRFVEPQLIAKNDFREMERESTLIDQHKFSLDQIKQSQAVLDDYEQMTDLARGYLNPSGHQDSRENKTATFTLTNVVPLNSSLYIGQWNTYDFKTMHEMNEGCTTTYVITGAVPGNKYVADGRVNVPSHIWSAACCLVGTEPRKAWGAIAENSKNQVKNLTLVQLEVRLTELFGDTKVTLFSNECHQQ